MNWLRLPCSLLLLSACQTPIAGEDTGGSSGGDDSSTGDPGPVTDSASDTGAPDPDSSSGEPTTQGPTTIEPDPTTTGDPTGPDVDPPLDCEGEVVHSGNLDITDEISLPHLECIVEVQGDLRIENTQSLVSFAPLANLKRVGGNVVIAGNAKLADLDGLAGLVEVGGPNYGDLELSNNPALVDITGLAALERVDSVRILHCSALADLTGLTGLIMPSSADNWSLGIASCDSITSLAPLAALDEFAGHLLLFDLENLTDLSPLSGFLAPTLEYLSVGENPKLTDLKGLEAVVSIDNLFVENNAGLLDLTGLDGLGSVASSLSITGNPKLASLAGLESLTSAGLFSIEGNPALASLAALADLESITGGLVLGTCGLLGNDALVDLHGLEGLTHLNALQVNENAALASMSAIPHGIGLGFLEAFNNPKLPHTSVMEYYAETPMFGEEWVCNNAGEPAVCECIFIEQP